MSKTIEMCTRVEGHGTLRMSMQRNKLSNVYFDIQAFRGFEHILQNKKLLDVPRIVSRVCGICYASHAITSCKALESLFEIEPSDQSIELRRLLMMGELINSHIMHFYFQALPDLFVLLKGEVNPKPLNELFRFDTIMRSNVFELIKTSKELITIFGGRSVHPITPIVGGISRAPSKKDVANARKDLQQSLSNIKTITERFENHFGKESPPSELELSNRVFLALQKRGKYSRYDGKFHLKDAKSEITEFAVEHYPKYFDIRDDIQGELPGIYSNNNQKLFVGPLSRYNIINDCGIGEVKPYLDSFKRDWKQNILFSNYLRLIEIMVEIYEGLAILEDSKLSKPVEVPAIKKSKRDQGIGVVEAPRGTLIHHYFLNERKDLKKVKLLVATEINIPTINEILTQRSIPLFEQEPDLEKVKKYAQMLLRTFDPCISCATH